MKINEIVDVLIHKQEISVIVEYDTCRRIMKFLTVIQTCKLKHINLTFTNT